jgi:excisionase family DNA binding protein
MKRPQGRPIPQATPPGPANGHPGASAAETTRRPGNPDGKRTKKAPPEPEWVRPPGPHLIEPTAVYSVAEAQAVLRLKNSTIRRELREGRLRVSKRAGRHYLLGEWLLEWLRGGEIKRRRQDYAGANGATPH